MKIRDAHARINGDKTVYEMPSGGINIIADDGNTLFSIDLKDNVLSLKSGHVCRHGDRILDDRYSIRPRASNLIEVVKSEYIPEKQSHPRDDD